MALKPLGDRVIVKADEAEAQTASGLYLATEAKEKPTTGIVVAVGEAYTKIAGGGAQADTALNVAAKVANYFKGKGGDVTKAEVTTVADKLRVSDGTTCVECDAAGNCSDCSER